MLNRTALHLMAALAVAVGVWALLPDSHAQPAQPAPERRGMTDRAFLGVMWEEQPDATLKLTQVHPGTPAWDAGLLKDDVIVGVEIHQDNKPLENQVAQPVYLRMGLASAAPGTTFKMKVRRGEVSLQVEKAFCIDFPREKLSIPAAESMIGHYQSIMKDWRMAPEVWITVKSASYREFSSFHLREQQIEIARLEILRLQASIERERAETRVAFEQIKTLIAQRNLAEAQQRVAELQAAEKGFSLLGSILSLLITVMGL